jgi:hypothetical protein
MTDERLAEKGATYQVFLSLSKTHKYLYSVVAAAASADRIIVSNLRKELLASKPYTISGFSQSFNYPMKLGKIVKLWR